MNLADVRNRVARILVVSDPEVFHGHEDELYVDVLTAVADGHPESREMALECLRVVSAERTRWYA